MKGRRSLVIRCRVIKGPCYFSHTCGCDVLLVWWRTQNGKGSLSPGTRFSVNQKQHLGEGDERPWETLGAYSVYTPRNTGEWEWHVEQRECQSCLLTLRRGRCETAKPAARRADGRFYFKGGQSGFFQSRFNLIFGLFSSPLRSPDFVWLFPV